jgi:predicted nuclease of predicted toxin-antitoxin system
MRFLLNMNVPRQLGFRLVDAGHEYRHVGDVGYARAKDVAIIEEARRRQETIITHDLDYGDLLAFSGEATPSVIIFRLRNTHYNNLFSRFAAAWSAIEKPLNIGAIIIIEDSTFRIRELPIY